MDFQTKIYNLSNRIEKTKDRVLTEEATKTSFILPLLDALGYDIFDPFVIVPEFTADIGTKKGEKVDYAIMKDEKPIILIEAKLHNEKLNRHKTQLERYFTVTDSKFAILTNGIEYKFYSDLEKPNVMDDTPFLVLNILKLKDRDLKQLERFSYESLDIDNILNMAGNKKYINGIKELFRNEAIDPSDDFARFFASKLTEKKMRHNVVDEFKQYIKQAFSEVVNDMVDDKINSIKEKLVNDRIESKEDVPDEIEDDNGIVTTEEELEGFFIVKSILAETVSLDRIYPRDTKSYFGILLEDNNRKWICRLYFNTSNKYLGIHTGEKEEEKINLNKIEDIYLYKDKIIDAIKKIDNQ